MLLEVKNLSVSFPEFTLHPVSFTLDRGESGDVSLVSPRGLLAEGDIHMMFSFRETAPRSGRRRSGSPEGAGAGTIFL